MYLLKNKYIILLLLISASSLVFVPFTRKDVDNKKDRSVECIEFAQAERIDTGLVKISRVEGNTASFNAIASFDISLEKQPTANVTIPIRSSDKSEGIIDIDKVIFTPENWNQIQEVVVKGRNKNVIDGKQDYKIILDEMQSDDEEFNGVDPDDVAMKGIYLIINEITDSTKFIAGLESTIQINVDYTGGDKLVFLLEEKPSGMTIESSTGFIAWTPPESAEGGGYEVKVKVSARSSGFSKEKTFNVCVAKTTFVKTETAGNVISVIDKNSNLNGLVITILDSNNAPNIVIKKVEDSALGITPEFVTRITDGFVVKNEISGDVKVKLPLSSLPAGADLNYVGLYSLVSAFGVEEKFWSPISTNTSISNVPGNPVVEISLPKLKGVFFIGIEEQTLSDNNNLSVITEPLKKTKIKERSLLTYENKIYTGGRIIPIEEINVTNESLQKYNGALQEATGKATSQKDIFDNLNRMITEGKIAGYQWDYTELMVSYPDGTQESILYSSSQKE